MAVQHPLKVTVVRSSRTEASILPFEGQSSGSNPDESTRNEVPMAFVFNCDRCGKELMEPGAIVGSPPFGNHKWLKFHICVECWEKLLDWMENNGNQRARMETSEDGCSGGKGCGREGHS